MVSTLAVLLVVAVVGLALNGLRLYGLIAVTILALQAPVISLVALALGVAGFIIYRISK
jgi:hypothetical protein